MRRELTPQQFTEWLAFRRIRGPIGGERADAYALMQASFTAGTQKVGAKDFMWWLESATESDDHDDDMYVPSAEERAWAAAMA